MTLHDATMRLLAEIQIMSDMQKQILKQTELLVQEQREAFKAIMDEQGDNRE